ncbi:polymerase 11 [Seminavis robusta]|uniref:Poly [ADP-ribose] polymerase n=1 Tax=Seminavis robusta TaxID=568900 RepID=A0A9N8HKX8_9STRA|nr:polymerase 11 [Seminavis robusta]|eukprot:Sro644_g180470.1 polymerase 11 (922) ;mRNA; r:26940-29943
MTSSIPVSEYHVPVTQPPNATEGNSSALEEEGVHVTIAGLYDYAGFPWAAELFNFTARLINNHEDGWFDDVLDGVELRYDTYDAACDQSEAVSNYLEFTRQGSPPHGIVGCRCSGPTKDVAFLGSLDEIPVVSPSATTPALSNKQEYSLFSRLVSPDDASGEVGALITVLQSFGWNRISIINTDNEYTNDLVTYLKNAWEGRSFGVDVVGEIAYTGTVKIIEGSEEVDPASVEQVLRNVPVDKPAINSKVIVLVAHHQHGYPVLQKAQEIGFQPDTIWVGVNAWTGQFPPPGTDVSWMPSVPGYIGIAPYRDLNGAVYQDYVKRLQEDQRLHNREISDGLSYWAADRTVDSILALSMALSKTPLHQRRNGTAVVEQLRGLKFHGVSGQVEFDEKGDWANPRFEVLSLQSNDPSVGWISLGTVVPGVANIDHGKVCYAEIGCVNYIPSEHYPIPWPVWAVAFLATLAVVVFKLCLVAFLYIREKHKKQPLKEQVRLLEDELRGIDFKGEAVQQRKGKLYHQIASLLDQPTPPHWTDDHGLVPVPVRSPEYLAVQKKMRETMNNDETCHITALYRVQNVGIWSYYVFRKNQLANKYGVDINDSDSLTELDVWHGTSYLNPDVIYNDMQEGFMVNYAQQGMYGRGIYFAERAGYADCYSYRVSGVAAPDESASFHEQSEREMFLVKLLVGRSAELNHDENEGMAEACRSLVAPPTVEGTDGLKYDTVTGIGDSEYGTRVHVVYENGRAYPEYLVRYRKERLHPSNRRRRRAPVQQVTCELDSTATTISCSEGSDAAVGGSLTTAATTSIIMDGLLPLPEDIQGSLTNDVVGGLVAPPEDIESGLPPPSSSSSAVWMYEADHGSWEPFGEIHQSQIEAAYERDPSCPLAIHCEPWTYLIDFSEGTQTNIDHPNNRQRKIQRMLLE